MKRIKIRNLGLSIGLTFTILYLTLVIAAALAGDEGGLIILPSILYSEEPLVINLTFWNILLGSVGSFIFGWCLSYPIAFIYNSFEGRSNGK
jgi:hypothetical protein